MKFLSLENGKRKLFDILAAWIGYDNSGSGLSATNVQDAIDEINNNTSDDCVGGQSASYVFIAGDLVGGCDADGN